MESQTILVPTDFSPYADHALQEALAVAEGVGAEFDFERDANGKVIALTLKQGGQVFRGERH